jgi:CHAD domain-containing protein
MPISQQRVRLVFQKLERDLTKLTREQSGNSVHGFRTGTRRLQTLFDDLLPTRDSNQKKLLKMLLRIRKRAGKVRDLDVQLAALRSLKTPQEPRRKTQLMHRLIELRAAHEKKLHKMLTKETVRDLSKRLKKALKAVNPEVTREPLGVAKARLGQIARPAGTLTEDVLHQYRMLGKRARYIAEFASKSPEADHLIAQLKRSQDAIGDWHDWLLLTEAAAKRLGDVRHSSLVAVLRNVTGSKFRRAVATLPAASPTQATELSLAVPPIASQKHEPKLAAQTTTAA